MNCVLFAKIYQVFSVKKYNIKKILENGKKYWKSQGILSVQKSGNPEIWHEGGGVLMDSRKEPTLNQRRRDTWRVRHPCV